MDGTDPQPAILPPPTGTSSPWRFAWLGLLILPLALSWDFFHFLSDYQKFHENALAGVEQLVAPLDPHEVIVVLTGDTGRIPRALELLRVRGSSNLVISGAAKGVVLKDLVNQQGASTAGLSEIWKKITLESLSSSTVENAQRTLEVVGPSIRKLILVTSDYHMRRSLAVFRSVFPASVQIIPFSVPSTPTGGTSFHFFWKTGAEYWKSLVYRLSLLLGMERDSGE